MIVDSPPGLVKIRSLPIVAHPLRLYLIARGLGIYEAAQLLNISVAWLSRVLAGRARFGRRTERFIANHLGVDVDQLFPATHIEK